MDSLERSERAIRHHLDHQGLALETGGTGMEPEVDDGFDASPRPLGRDLTRQPEPRGGPGGSPRRPGLEGLEVIEIGTGLDRQPALVAVDEREDPLPQLALDAFLDEVAVAEHAATLFPPTRSAPER